ncbi:MULTISPECIES: DUF2163 domain-containing protein [unclassified Thioalkalivibrio]|uniref:DUF2163 domain-containing protein n=1 Tax=unclassified Thioalkalivibrio TaxID=2621013 RepID=UPI0003607C88|nr:MULTISPECIES: DUF2163 domain-containing protein [unclassified Thioalkalivibrio]
MKDIGGLADLLEQEVTTLATCWRLERRDGFVIRATDHDHDLTVDGETYAARTGYTRSALATTGALSVDNADLDGVLSTDTITAEDIRAGLYDHAELRVFAVDWQDPDAGRINLRRGWIGDVTLSREGHWHTSLRGMTQALAQNIIESYTPNCRADLGDNRCKVDLSEWTHTGVILGPGTDLTLEASISDTDGVDASIFEHGVLTWTSGQNEGKVIEVTAVDLEKDTITLAFPPSYTPAAGDEFEIYAGCDKRLETCRDRFDNVLNFRGEPFIPGNDSLMEYPDG